MLVVVLAAPALAASGDLDPAFSGDGILVTRTFQIIGEDMALQSGGQIVSVGQSEHDLYAFGAIRIRANGRRDPTFGGDGDADIPIAPVSGGSSCYRPTAQAVATTADGHILVAGDGCGRIALGRLQHDGDLDPTFGTNGLVLTDVRALKDVTGIALDPSGNIYVAGDNQAGDVVVARYRKGGALDDRFAHDGVRVVSVPDDAHVSAIALQQDGSVLVAGRTYRSPEYPLLRPFVARLLPNSGKLDPSFGTDGVALLDVEGAFTALTVENDQPVAVGWIQRRVVVARFTSAGLPDGTFGPGGIRKEDLIPGCCDRAFGVTVASSGDLLVAACAGCSARSQYGVAVLAYLDTGELDPSFGQGGRTLTPGIQGSQGLSDAGPRGAVAVDGQGRIVVGTTLLPYGPGVFARFLP